MSDFEQIGGQQRLQTIIDEFVDLMFADPMIGFYFRHADPLRIKKFEFQHAAKFLGANTEYEGRSLRTTHKPHQIFSGHFDRRKKLLADVLLKYEVPAAIRERWLNHTESLRNKIVVGQC